MKRGDCIRFFCLCFLLIFLLANISALRVSPAVISYNFEPGFEGAVTYKVTDPDSDKEFELYVDGDLKEYFSIDKDKLIGGGSFTVDFRLPNQVEKPGKHRVYIGVREKFDEELAGSAIGTTVTVQAVIVIHVPYPGRYLEIDFTSHDANLGEPIDFLLDIYNKGKEDVIANPSIEIFSESKTVEILSFEEREIFVGGEVNLIKVLDTSNYNSGNYLAMAIVNYGNIVTAELEFRIGELVINIVNYTKKIGIGGIRNFDIEIESGWNDRIDGAYGSVTIFNETHKSLANFQTSSTNLDPWEKKIIQGFFDTTNFAEGTYDANITLIYYGKSVGVSSSEIVKLEFVDEKINILMISLIAGGLILLIIIAFIIKKYFFKKKSKKK